jgi:hypothetical protein
MNRSPDKAMGAAVSGTASRHKHSPLAKSMPVNAKNSWR